MPKKPKPAPAGMMKLGEIEARSNRRWKAHALRRMIKEGRFEKVTGAKAADVDVRPRIVLVRQQAGERLIRIANTYTVSLQKLAKKMGLDPLTLRTANYVNYEKVGRQWFTTPSEAKNALAEKRFRDGSYSSEEFAALCGRDRHTVLRWMKRSRVPTVPDGVFSRIPKKWADENAHRLRPERIGRYLINPNEGRKGRALPASAKGGEALPEQREHPLQGRLMELNRELKAARVGIKFNGSSPRQEEEILREIGKVQEKILPKNGGQHRKGGG